MNKASMMLLGTLLAGAMSLTAAAEEITAAESGTPVTDQSVQGDGTAKQAKVCHREAVVGTRFTTMVCTDPEQTVRDQNTVREVQRLGQIVGNANGR